MLGKKILFIFIIGLVFSPTNWTLAATSSFPLLTQWEGDDSYDPFADYSEFEETSEEEADINFFRNGRLFTLAFAGGFRGFTGNLGERYYHSAGSFGIMLNYFFDLRFAMTIGFLTGDHSFEFASNIESIYGTVNFTDFSINLKFYLNTQNVTQGLATLNPYLIGGFSQIYRTTTLAEYLVFVKDDQFGFTAGAGIEIPILRNKMFFGAQGHFTLVTFKDESQETVLPITGVRSGVTPTGDTFVALLLLGINF